MYRSFAELWSRFRWSVSRKTAGALVGLVAADALEDARAVVQPVRADVDRRIGPVDELAVHPDLLGLAHRSPPWASPVTVMDCHCGAQRLRGGFDGVHRLVLSPGERGRRTRASAMWLGEPAPIHTRLCDRRFRSTKTRSTAGSGNGATAPATKPVAFSHLLRRRDLRPGRTGRPSDLGRVGAPVARHERDHPAAVAVEDERLHDLSELAADRARRVGCGRRARLELLDPRLDAHLAQEARDALDRLRPCGPLDQRLNPRPARMK